MHKLLVIAGPTATGKTKLALGLIKSLNGEIISADSRQVYKYMDIGTGKDKRVIASYLPVRPAGGLRIANYDLVNPDQKFSVADYLRLTVPVVNDIWQRKKLPIVVGGTGFYIKALIDGIESIGVEPDWELRRELEKLSVAELQTKLRSLQVSQFNRMNQSDRNNPRRLIRKIEIIKNLKLKDSLKIKNLKLKIDRLLMIGLTAPRQYLFERIEKRVRERVKEGMEEEIRRLLKRGYNWDNSVMGTTLGYREWRGYFEDKLSKEAVMENWRKAEREYVQRQLVWFKREKRLLWLDISKQGWENKVKVCLEKSRFLAER